MLPERLSATWNAGDIADDVIALGESPLVFVETRGATFPRSLLYRVFAARAGRLVVLFGDDQGAQHSLIVATSREPELLTLERRGEPREPREYTISDNPPPHTTLHGDVRYTLDAT